MIFDNVPLLYPYIVILALILYILYKKTHKESDDTDFEQYGKTGAKIEETDAHGRRIIEVLGLSDEELDYNIRDFIDWHPEDTPNLTYPQIKAPSFQRHLLLMNEKTDFWLFGYWVNFLTWREDGSKTKVTGWYDTQTVTSDPLAGDLSHQTLMFYVPDWEEEPDNFYFVDAFSRLYMQSFQANAPLVLCDRTDRQPEPVPEEEDPFHLNF